MRFRTTNRWITRVLGRPPRPRGVEPRARLGRGPAATAASFPLWILACAAPAPEAPVTLPYSTRLIDRMERAQSAEAATPAVGSRRSTPPQDGSTPIARSLPAVSEDTVRRGLVSIAADRRAVIDHAAKDRAALGELLQTAISATDLAALAVARSNAVRAAWEAYEAARTSYQQSKDLEDLVGMYQSFTVDSMTRVGPNRSSTPTAMVAPSPNVNALSAEVAKRTTEIALQSVRAAVRDAVAKAWELHADAVRLAEARRILSEEVALDRVLLDIQRSHLESGSGSQAGYLAFESRLARLASELEILDQRRDLVRAQWNGLLSRTEEAPVELDVRPAELTAELTAWFQGDEDNGREALDRASKSRPELLSARLVTERAELALRLAETMVLPRFDVGASRLEPGGAFPEPGRMMAPRADFGVREAQVQEMRARAAAMKSAEAALSDRVQVEIRAALFMAKAALARREVHERAVVPLAQDALEAARGAYEGNRASYLDLLAAAQGLLDARLGLADARRDQGHAVAGLVRAVGESP